MIKKIIIFILSVVFVFIFSLLFLIEPGGKNIEKSDWILYNDSAEIFLYQQSKINYIKLGEGYPVILLHGGGSWSYSFRNNIIPLSKHFTVFAIDIPGHGYSEIPNDWEYTLENINDLLLSFFEYHKIDHAHIIGNSWGGGCAIYFAQNNPEKIGKIVLIAPTGLSNSNKYDKSLWKYLTVPGGKIILHFVTLNSVRVSYEKELFYNRHLVTDDIINEIYNPLNYSKNLLAQYKYQKNLDWNKTGNNLHRLRDVMFIWGQHDQYLPIEMLDEYMELIPTTEKYILQSSSHLPHEEEYNEVNEIIINFLN